MKINIPFSSESKKNEPLRRCVEETASRFGMSEFEIASMASYFLEQVAEQVASGKAVAFPGFGRWGHYLYRPRKEGLAPHVIPTFHASRGFRMATALGCPADPALDEKTRTYRRNHFAAPDGRTATSSRPMTAGRAFRQHVAKQAERAGIILAGVDGDE